MKNTKKLVGAVAALAIASALATGTTYAWFTSNGTAKVDSFSAKVVAEGDDLEVVALPVGVAYDEDSYGAYKTTLEEVDIARAVLGLTTSVEPDSIYDDDYSNIALDALTTSKTYTVLGADDANHPGARNYTATAATTGAITLYTNNNSSTDVNSLEKATKASWYTKSGDTVTKAEGKYITFDLVFRSKTSNLYLCLYDDSTVTTTTNSTADIEANEKVNLTASYYNADTITSATATIPAAASNAVRIAFTNGYKSQDVGTDNNGDVVASTLTNTFWAPNEYYVTGEQYTGTDTSTTKGASPLGYYKNNLASDWCLGEGYKEGYVASTVALPSGLTLLANGASQATSSSTIGQMSAVSGTYAYYRTTVVLWLEGTDGDCFNALYNDVIQTVMRFKALTAVAS